MLRGRQILLATSATAVLAFTTPAFAQDDASDDMADAGPALSASNDIIVTARRRDERLQDVPLAVSAVSQETLERAQITSVADLRRVAPSLSTQPGIAGGRSIPNFAIRGLSQEELAMVADASVPVYLGDIVAARAQGVNGAVYDIKTVEVLRGPQGTLFGRNATGGAVVIRPAEPTSEFAGRVSATVGNLDTVNVDAMINVPLSDSVMVRAAAIRKRDDGYLYDTRLKRTVDFTRQEGARLSFLFEDGPIKSLTTYEYFNEDSGGTPSIQRYVFPGSGLNSPGVRAARNYEEFQAAFDRQQALGPYTVENGMNTYTKVRTHTLQNRTEIELNDSITFRNILGYRKVDSHTLDNIDGTPNTLFVLERLENQKQFSAESQFLGTMGNLEWIAGAFYFWEEGRSTNISSIGGADPGLLELFDSVEEYPGTPRYSDPAAENESYAVFAQGTYDFAGIVDGLSITAGIRYNWDNRRAIIRSTFGGQCAFTVDDDNNPSTPEVLPPIDQCIFDDSASFSEPTYNLSLEYRFDSDHLVYLAHRHGYRTGGYGTRANTSAGLEELFSPETVDDVELGIKADWRPGGTFLRTNLAGYYAKYDDIQRLLVDSVTNPLNPVTVTANAGKARIWGVEADVLFRPVPSLELTGNYAYTNTKFTSFIDPYTGADLSGAEFARAPKNVYTLGARYFLPIDPADGEIYIGGSYYHTDGFSTVDNADPPYTDIAGWNLVDLDAGWDGVMGSNFDVRFFVKNLTKEKYVYGLSNIRSVGFTSGVPGAPRTYGITVRAHFGSGR